MKKYIVLCIILMLTLAACSTPKDDTSKDKQTKETRTYKTESGKEVQVPKEPKRIAVLTAFYVGDFVKLGHKPVAVPDFVKDSKTLKPHLKDVSFVSADDVEKIASLKPDLIVVDATDKNIKKFEKLAPTIPYEYNDYKHTEIMKEIGKLVGEEKAADQWIADWNKQIKEDRKEIEKAVGKSTATVFEPDAKTISIFESNWGRGSDIVNDEYGMPVTKAYQEKLDEKKEGYATISKERITDYAGDFILLSKNNGSTFDFEKTNAWKQLPAVKNDRVITYKGEDYWFNDAITIEALRKYLKEEILKRA